MISFLQETNNNNNNNNNVPKRKFSEDQVRGMYKYLKKENMIGKYEIRLFNIKLRVI